MSIESKIPQGEINIKDLQLEASEEKIRLSFDADTEINKKAWETIFGWLEIYKQRGQWTEYLQHIRYIQILSPERTTDVKWDEGVLDEAIDSINSLRKTNKLDEALKVAAELKPAFPEKKAEYSLNPEELDRAVANLNSALLGPSDQWENLCGKLSAFKIAEPNKFSKIELNKPFYNYVLSRINFFLRDPAKSKDSWKTIANLSAEAKIIYPDILNDLKLTKQDWEDMRALLKSLTKPQRLSFFKLAANMKILAAKKINFTDQGIVLNMEEVENSTLLLPISKKF